MTLNGPRWYLSGGMRSLIFAGVLWTALGMTGCGSGYYAVSMNAAEHRLEEARRAGAEESAPFEFYYAEEHLRQARIEAAEASYGDAATYAQTAESYAQKALDLAHRDSRENRGERDKSEK